MSSEVLPIDNLLKPKKKYIGEDHHKVLLEKRHQIFILATKRSRRAQKKRNERINKGKKEVELCVGDPVFYAVEFAIYLTITAA